MNIERLQEIRPDQTAALLAIWESSVRATHAFLSETDIAELKGLVPEYFGAVDLWIARGDGEEIMGFAGIAGDMLAMLFVRAQARGQGVGRALVAQALGQGVTRLDVNEQNPQAVGFYEHMGFIVTGRSALDGQGKPFPLLHMRLKTATKARPTHPA